jgi:hypothetical protein
MKAVSTILILEQNDSTEWNHAASPKKKARAISLAVKIMGTVFWDAEE